MKMDGVPFRSPVSRAAAVCYRRQGESLQFMLVQTRRGQWTFPKGRIEAGESPWRAAEREALEEAGVRGRIVPELLTTYPYEKCMADGGSVVQTVAAYLLHVESDRDTAEPWRNPTWFAPEEAKQRLGLGRGPSYREAHANVIDEACTRLASDNTDLRG
jgi:8-oxo-dGTP pyrophosphatase MutT (NUDIX family)